MQPIFRKISVILGITIFILGIYFSLQIGNANSKTNTPKKTASLEAAQTMVFAQIVNNQSHQSTVNISGKVIARQKIDLFAEVNGQLLNTPKAFQESTSFKKGDLMLQIDDTEARLELQAQRSQLYSIVISLLPVIENDYNENLNAWRTYLEQFSIDNTIQAFPEAASKREKLFIAGKNIHQMYFNIKKMEFRLDKYKIYAPFNGILSNTNTYEGALIRAGQKLGVLSHPSNYELEASVSLYDIPFFRSGNRVNLYTAAYDQTWKGTVSRLGKTVDPTTQTQKLFIRLNSTKLNEGMFLNGQVNSKTIENVVKLPRTLLVNNGFVYTIEEGKLKLTPVEIIKIENNDMYVRGLKNNTSVLAKLFLEAYDGMPVKIIK